MSTVTQFLLAAAAASLLLAAGSAKARDVTVYANSEEDLPRRTVSYADLDLAAATGQKTLTRRVSSAVRAVCRGQDIRGMLSLGGDCFSIAWNGARPQMAQAIARATQIAQDGNSNIATVVISVRGVAQ